MLTENLTIYRDTFELCRMMMLYMNDVPRSHRFGEYGRAVSMALDALDMIYVANSSIEERPAALARYLRIIGGVRSRVRLFTEARVLPPKRSVNLMTLIERVSRQATGWRNNSQGQSRQAKANREGSPYTRDDTGLSLSPDGNK